MRPLPGLHASLVTPLSLRNTCTTDTAARGLQTCAQVLLSLGNLAARGQYINARNTFDELFAYGAVPVVNENDTVAVEELRIGDNDTLSAQVSPWSPFWQTSRVGLLPQKLLHTHLSIAPARPFGLLYHC